MTRNQENRQRGPGENRQRGPGIVAEFLRYARFCHSRAATVVQYVAAVVGSLVGFMLRFPHS
jgi:hypothetical protein